MKKALIFCNGELNWPSSLALLKREEYEIYCADGGAERCRQMGIRPDFIIGDLDSISQETLKEMRELGVTVQQYPREKDQTDLDLAIMLAISRGAQAISILSACGGRIDHELENVFLLAHPRYLGVEMAILNGQSTLRRLSSGQRLIIEGAKGDTVSLLPLSAQAEGVCSSGLKWVLKNSCLTMGSSLGMSNEMIDSKAILSLERGLLLVVHSANQ